MPARVHTVWLVAGLLTVALAAGGVGWWRLQQRQHQQVLAQQVETTVQELRRGLARTELRPLLELLEHDRAWRDEYRLLAGADRLRKGEVDAALLFLGSIEPQGDRRLVHQLWLGEALYQAGRLPEADTLFARLVSDFPHEADAHRWVATILYDSGQLNPAMAALDRASQLAPDDFLPHRLMALTYVQDFRQYDDAIRHYRLALDRTPPAEVRDELLRELAQCLVFQKEFAEALEVVRRVPESPRQQLVQIEALRGLGETDAAQAVWNRLQQSAPQLEGVALLGGMLDLDQGRGAEARQNLQGVLGRDPHNLVARNLLIRAWQMLGETDRAKAEAERLTASKTLHDRHDLLATQAMAEPDNRPLRLELANLCDQLGRPADAARWRRNASRR